MSCFALGFIGTFCCGLILLAAPVGWPGAGAVGWAALGFFVLMLLGIVVAVRDPSGRKK